jgi:MFS family permease
LTEQSQSFAALRHPGYRPYLTGSMLAMMADSVEHVVSYWIIFDKFHSPALGGFAIFSHWIPFVFFSVYSGALADRYDPRRIIQIGMGLFMLASAAWGFFFVTGTLTEWIAAAILVVHGFAGVFWSPASQIMIHDIVGRREMNSAVRLMATSRMLGLLLGPAIGGAMLVGLGPEIAIFCNIAFYLPLTLWLWKAPYGPKFRAEQTPARQIRGLADIVAAMKAVAGDRVIVSMTLLAGFASLLVGNAHQAQMPEYAQDLGYGGAGIHYSMLLAANAAGALTAGIVLEAGGLLGAKPRSAFFLVMFWCFAMAGFAAATSYWLALALLFVAGFVNLAFTAMTQTLVQLSAPQATRGRVIGIYNMAGNGLRAFSGLTVGVGGDFIGIHWSLALSAAALLMVTMGLFGYALKAAYAEAAAE